MTAVDDWLGTSMKTSQSAPADPVDAWLGTNATPAAATPPSAAAPAASQPQVLPGFLTGVGDEAKGVTQGIVHALSWAADKVAPNSQFAKDARAALPQIQQTIDTQNQQYEAQRAANGQTGIDWGRLAGNAFGTAPTLALGPEYAGLSLPGRVTVGALQGAAGAGMLPTSAPQDGQSFAGQKAEQMGIGGALGAAGPVVTGALGGIGRGLWNTIQPVVQPGRFVGRGLANALDPQAAADAAANIRNAQIFVPGSTPTTAQVAGNPVIVQTEKALANSSGDFKSALLNRAIDNNDARWQALMGVAQDQPTLDAAIQARSAAAQPLYDAAHQSTANVGPAFMRYAQIPEMQEAMQRANQIASLDAAVGRGVPPVWPTQNIPGVQQGSRAINGAALDYTSRALGDMIGEAQRAGSNTRAGALTQLRNMVDSWTQQYIPGVQQARAAYAAGSVPVNTMEVGQQIANGLGTRAMNSAGVPEIQMMPFRSALTQAMNSGNAAQFGIDAGALNTLQGIGQDLQRATVSNSIKSPGSDTAYNIAANGWLARHLYGPAFQGASGLGKAAAAAGALVSGHPLAAGGVLAGANRLGQAVGGRLQDRLGNYLLDPATVLPYLDARATAPAGQAAPGPLVRGLLNYGRPTLTNGILSGFLGPANQ